VIWCSSTPAAATSASPTWVSTSPTAASSTRPPTGRRCRSPASTRPTGPSASWAPSVPKACWRWRGTTAEPASLRGHPKAAARRLFHVLPSPCATAESIVEVDTVAAAAVPCLVRRGREAFAGTGCAANPAAAMPGPIRPSSTFRAPQSWRHPWRLPACPGLTGEEGFASAGCAAVPAVSVSVHDLPGGKRKPSFLRLRGKVPAGWMGAPNTSMVKSRGAGYACRSFSGNHPMPNLPPVTRYLLIANVLVFALQLFLHDANTLALSQHFALWPLGPDQLGQVAGGAVINVGFRPWQLVTYAFMHGGFEHI